MERGKWGAVMELTRRRGDPQLVAQLRGISEEQLALSTSANARRVLDGRLIMSGRESRTNHCSS